MFKKKEEEEKVEASGAHEAGEASGSSSAPEAGEASESSSAREAGGASESRDSSSTSPASNSSDPSSASDPSPAEPDWKTLYALTLADFDNYKKRAARDREETYRYAESDILKDVLPAVDNLQLALDNAKDKTEDPFVKGVQLVHDTLLKSLKDHGAEPFDSIGKELDTEKMEAIATLPSEEFEEGKVSIESKKGWMLKGKVLRAAQVVVSSGKPQ